MTLLPTLDADNTPFWTGGAEGRLMIAHCGKCHRAIHPPLPICPACLTRDVAFQPALGSGIVHSFTINHHRWLPDLAVPYTLVTVDLDGEAGVRITSQLVDAGEQQAFIGQPVMVVFEQASDDVWIPKFRARESGDVAQAQGATEGGG